MSEHRAGHGLVALIVGCVLGLAVYIAVAPFQCTDAGACNGAIAFQYSPGSAGHRQAVGAALVVGGIAAVLVWLVVGATSPGHRAAMIIATPLLLAGIVVSVFSQSVLFVIGPLVGGLVLGLMWRPTSSTNPPHTEPGPWHSRT